jgi:hypothetical protein
MGTAARNAIFKRNSKPLNLWRKEIFCSSDDPKKLPERLRKPIKGCDELDLHAVGVGTGPKFPAGRPGLINLQIHSGLE